MGTWGTDVFADDLASDICGTFSDSLKETRTVVKASEVVLRTYADRLNDQDDALIVYLALAKLQLDANALDRGIADRALRIIQDGSSLIRWKEVGGDELESRKTILAKLEREIRAAMQT